MEFFIAIEWTDGCGLKLSDMYPFREGIDEYFKDKEYGGSISAIWIVLNCLGHDWKQRKRYKKALNRFEYDVMLDFPLIEKASPDDKRRLIQNQFYAITKQTFEKYKFEDFDKAAFLDDLKKILETVKW